jgi:hypothetical protein
MSDLERGFNRSGFSRFLNSPAGRLFRVVVGTAFLVVGVVYRVHVLGLVAMAWGLLVIIAGALDVCFASALLGGPLSGAKIREKQKSGLASKQTTP